MTTPIPSASHPDVVLVGAGIMSATLAVILKELDPSLKIEIYEVLASEAQESSNAWNNAGTGHAALCELNYTPQSSDGSVDISKALQVNTEFDLSRQLWAYLVKMGAIKDPQSFIHPVPHFSFVRGPQNHSFLKKRFDALTPSPVSRDGVFRRQEADSAVDPAGDGGPRSKRGSCGDANADWYRRGLRRAHQGSSQLPEGQGRILDSLFPSGAGSAT